MKYAWIEKQAHAVPLTEMCEVLDVSISGYRAWKRGGTPDRKRLTNGQLVAVIGAIDNELNGCLRQSADGARVARARLYRWQGARGTIDA